MRALGWNDEAVYFAISVCALFNFYNRWIDAGGVQALSDEAHRQGAKAPPHRDTSTTPRPFDQKKVPT